MIGHYARIKSDNFDIAKRLKEIDKNYFVVYSYKKRRFEVHNSAQRGGSFCLAVPYPCLDYRTILLVRQTSSARAEQFLSEINEDNQRQQKLMIEQQAKSVEIKVEQALKGEKA